ncbi:histidinol-phosphatase [Vibrio sp. S9_S30]|uniref:histidinol-phosphatase n=1 Tax=Vibrio sp. S9_S30 TaxID=2720226 RepID=UPI001680154B|nr:histidinol-phosphatase [Vibrio sp. S9_S30]MBD1558166.1 histidinol-phosphatase [Vibrio sp. S9_S30]
MDNYLVTIDLALDKSRRLIEKYFRTAFRVENKSDQSPVTIADREVESVIREVIASRHSDHNILGEEHGLLHKQSDYKWIIDPIDGTKSFITGMPTFGTLIALTRSNQPFIGVIDMPILKECWVGILNKGTFKGDVRCHTSGSTNLEKASLYCTEPDMFSSNELERFEALASEVSLRRFGGDCYSYGLLASGHIDLVVEGSLQYYDVVALIPIVEEAGGVITDWEGNPIQENWNGLAVAAASRELHQAALSILFPR